MVKVLANLDAKYNDSSLDKPLFLKKAMLSYYWKEFKKTIYAEFQSFIKNDTWEYKNTPSRRVILTVHWVFKIDKDRWGKILKFIAR